VCNRKQEDLKMRPTDNEQPRMLGSELIIPVLAVAFTLYFFSTIWNSPWTAQVSAFLVGGVLLTVCTLLLLRFAFLYKKGRAILSLGYLFSRDDISSGRVGLIISTVAYCALIDRLGFTLTTFLFLSISMLILSKGNRPALICVSSAIISLCGWAVFILAFDTRFPRGWYETTMKAVLSNG
jgi:hypothetical protein